MSGSKACQREIFETWVKLAKAFTPAKNLSMDGQACGQNSELIFTQLFLGKELTPTRTVECDVSQANVSKSFHRGMLALTFE
jgi:hypothetical protein